MHEHHRDRLRDKVFVNVNSLNEYEMLELILFNAMPRKNTNDIAHRLIDEFGSTYAVLNASVEELMRIEGVGKTISSYLVTLGVVLKKCQDEESKFPTVFSFNDIRQPLIDAFRSYTEEVFMAFFLTKRNKIFARKTIYGNSQVKVDIDLTDLSKQVLLAKPAAVVIAHNHLNDCCYPSEDDDKATEKICMVLSLAGVPLLDHIIVSGENTYSYYYDKRLDKIRNIVELKLK